MNIVIVGNGPAAIAAVEAIRGQGREDSIVMVSKEDSPCYSPCPLAEYVEGSVPRGRLFLRPEGFYRDLKVQTLFGRAATALNPESRRVTVGIGEAATELPYDRLLIATGAKAVLPPIPGLAWGEGVVALKTLGDAEAILARIEGVAPARRAVVIGSGFIGLEAAQALIRRGLEVTVIEALEQVLPQMLDAEVAAKVEARLRTHGIDVRVGAPVEAVLHGPEGVSAVRAGGSAIDCDLVVCAAGVRPDLGWLAGSGLETAIGVRVDERMATNLPDVFAAGDIIETLDTQGARRVLGNWPNAVNGGRIAGLNMIGAERRYRGLDAINVVRIFDLPVASFGSRTGERTVTWEGGGHVRRLVLNDGRIVGGQFFGDVNEAGLYLEMMNKGVEATPFERDLLTPRFGMGHLLPRPPRPTWSSSGSTALLNDSSR